jgi:hypothetical protein
VGTLPKDENLNLSSVNGACLAPPGKPSCNKETCISGFSIAGMKEEQPDERSLKYVSFPKMSSRAIRGINRPPSNGPIFIYSVTERG